MRNDRIEPTFTDAALYLNVGFMGAAENITLSLAICVLEEAQLRHFLGASL